MSPHAELTSPLQTMPPRQQKHIVYIGPDGLLKFVYHDGLAALQQLGETLIARASHVEPAPQLGWTADLTPSGGPILGPYPLRSQALDAEVTWLDQFFQSFEKVQP